MPFYRQVLLVRKSASPNELSSLFKRCAQFISNEHGVFHGIDHRGVKELGYPIVDRRHGEIERHRVARLMVTGFTASTTTLKELENTLKLDETVVRFETFRCKDPLREFLNRKMDPEELLHEHLPAATATAAELEQELEADDDDSEEYENVGREFFGNDNETVDEEIKVPKPHWRRDLLYTEPPENNNNKR